MTPFTANLSLNYAPTIARFMEDRSDIRIIKGPVGSGKTTGLCFAVLYVAMTQERSPVDGVRYTRPVILRNTYSELKTTTIQTWKENFPEDIFGTIGGTPPITQHIKIPGELDCEVYFLAIDQPKDVRKLLSLNISHLFFNEMREFNEDLIKRAWDRVGRFPNPAPDKHGVECTYPCMMGDTNPPDEDHWMYEWEHDKQKKTFSYDASPLTLKFFNQPGAVLDVTGFDAKKRASIMVKNLQGPEDSKAEANLRVSNKEFAIKKGLTRFWDIIRAGGREYMVNPLAENIPNLRRNYYPSKVPLNDREDIRVYYESKYGVVGHGKPVIPEYNDDLMSVEDLPVLKDTPLGICADVGGGTLSPSALIFQRHPRGILMFHAEIVCFDMGNEEFCNQINQTMCELFPGRELEYGYGDPAGMTRDEIFETIVFDFMRSKGIPIKGAQTNNISARIEALKNPMTKMIDGKPGILINKRCKVIRAGLAGKWVFRRLQVAGSERYADKPDKGKYSHVCFTAGTIITSFSGQQPIEELRVGDLVNTPYGLKKITHTGKRKAHVISILLSNGEKITCTPDHPFWISCGYSPADRLRYGNELFTEDNKLWMFLFRLQKSVLGRNGQYTNIRASGILGSLLQGIIKVQLPWAINTCIEWFGKTIMAPSLTALSFIILIMIPPITTFQIFGYCQHRNTKKTIWPNLEGLKNPCMELELPLKQPHKKENPTQNGQEHLIKRLGKHPDGLLKPVKEKWSVRSVIKYILESLLSQKKVTVVGLVEHEQEDHVYNITVEDAGCYFAGGILVSNCDAAAYGSLGSGEYQAIHGRKKLTNRKPIRVKTRWDPLYSGVHDR